VRVRVDLSRANLFDNPVIDYILNMFLGYSWEILGLSLGFPWVFLGEIIKNPKERGYHE